MRENVPPAQTGNETAPVPAKVAGLAGQRQLGVLVATHTGHSPLKILLFAVGMVAVGVGVAALGAFLRFLFVLGLAIIFFAFVAVAFGVKAVAAGTFGSFVYSGGFVHREKRRLRAVGWTEVAALRRVRAGSVMPAHPKPETVIGHQAVLHDGALLDVGSEKVTPRVEQAATAAGVLVTG
jgi:hypothetical protein